MTKATSKAEARRRGRNSAKANITLVNGVGGTHTRDGRKKDQTVTVKAQRLANGVPAALVADPLAGHELGKLRLAGTITIDEYEAGIKYQEIRAAFMSKIIGASINIRAQCIKGNAHETGEGKQPSQEDIDSLKSQHEPMMGAVMRSRGWQIRSELERVIMADKPPYRVHWLSIGLRALAEWKDGR